MILGNKMRARGLLVLQAKLALRRAIYVHASLWFFGCKVSVYTDILSALSPFSALSLYVTFFGQSLKYGRSSLAWSTLEFHRLSVTLLSHPPSLWSISSPLSLFSEKVLHQFALIFVQGFENQSKTFHQVALQKFYLGVNRRFAAMIPFAGSFYLKELTTCKWFKTLAHDIKIFTCLAFDLKWCKGILPPL